jgi:hypothetical protein
MKKYEQPKPSSFVAFPKPIRLKKSPTKIRREAAETDCEGNAVAIPDHNDLLSKCVELIQSEPGMDYLHIPDLIYRLIQFYNPDDKLSIAIDRAMGTAQGLKIKQEIAEAFKNKPDLIVYYPIGNGFSLTYQGDVKTGGGKLSQGQRRWGRKTSVCEIRDIDKFNTALGALRVYGDALRKIIFPESSVL